MDEKPKLEEAKEGMLLKIERVIGESDGAFNNRYEMAIKCINELSEEDINHFKELIDLYRSKGIILDSTHTTQLAGIADEILFEKQYSIENPERIRTVLNRQLVNVVNNPPKELEDKFYMLNRPDLFDLVYSEEEQRFVIYKAIEVTHGIVEDHKFEQIVNYKQAVQKMIKIMSENPNILMQNGYKELAENINSFRVSNDFSVELVLSAEKDPDDMSTFIGDLENEKISELDDMIYDKSLEVRNSAFSKEELINIGIELLRLIE